jgi:short-subunit dehydrogenase
MGIGKLVAERFARDGAKVVIWDMNSEALEKTASEFSGKGYEVYTSVVDVSDREKVYQEAEKVKKEIGTVDVLMNNAGIVRGGPFLDTNDEDDFNTLNINFISHMWTCKAFLPDMVARNDGHVIAMSSAMAFTPTPGAAAYAASKAAVLMFTNTIRWELKNAGKNGVKFTSICPTAVNTGMFEGVKPPIINPWLEQDVIADRIYRAYQRNRNTLLEPLVAKFTTLVPALPEPVAYFTSKIIKLSTMFDTWVGH